MKRAILILSLAGFLTFGSCKGHVSQKEKEEAKAKGDTVVKTAIGNIMLPPPYATKSVNNSSDVVGWGEGEMPKAPENFTVTKFTDTLKSPRNTYIAPNNDIFIVESGTKSSRDRITMYRDKDKDGNYESGTVYLDDLNQPYGVLVLNGYFYVANTDGLYRYPYDEKATSLEGKGEKIVNLPAGGYNNHWTRNLIANADGSKIYISVGSGSNNAEHGMENETRRADILEVDPDGKNERIYASGLRNPVGMDWNPVTHELWTAVNERDELGDNLVPDYITSLKPGGFYGWPYSYYGQNADPRMKGEGKELVARAIVPDVPVGSHTASLGLAFYNKNTFPAKYRNGAFVGQHGSWNRAVLSGYKVVFVPFKDGKPSAEPQDFLTGFIKDESKEEVNGRPVDVTVMNDGSLLVNDDSGNVVWKISYNK